MVVAIQIDHAPNGCTWNSMTLVSILAVDWCTNIMLYGLWGEAPKSTRLHQWCPDWRAAMASHSPLTLLVHLAAKTCAAGVKMLGRMQRNWWFIISGFSTSMLVYRVTNQVLVDRENCQKLGFTWASNPCLKNPKLQNPVIFWYGNQHKNERWPFGSIESTPYRLLISQNMVKLAVKASPFGKPT